MKLVNKKILSAALWTLVILSQAACLRTRGMIREGQSFDVDPPGAQSTRAPQADSYLIDELKAEIARLTGRIEELERSKAESAKAASEPNPQLKAYDERIAELEKTQLAIIETIKGQKKTGQATAVAGASQTAGPSSFEKGKALFQAGKFEQAIEVLSQYISQSGKTASTEEAIQLLGESHYLLKQYQAAIVEYSKIQEKYPKSKRVPGAILRIAESFDAMGFADDAKGFYQELISRFPKSPEARKAADRTEKKGDKKSSKPKTRTKVET